jgi:hypothetical protein
MNGRHTTWRIVTVLGGVMGYGCLAAFLSLVGLQVRGWFKEGDWPHISIGDAIRALLGRMQIPDDATGPLARLSHWLDAPVDWLGLHKVVEVMPASLALFAAAILGNFLFVYGSDRLRDGPRGN